MAFPNPDPNPNPNPNPEPNQNAGAGSKGQIDPITVKTFGLNDIDIQKSGYQVVPMNLEDSWNVNKGNYPNMSVLEYQKYIYNPVMGESVYDVKRQREILKYDDPDYSFLETIRQDAKGRTGGVTFNTHPSNWGIDERTVIGWSIYDGYKKSGEIGKAYVDGKRTNTMTVEQIMDSKKKYYNPTNNTEYNLDNYYSANAYGSPFRVDENGDEWMLVKDYQKEMWAEVPASSVIDGRNVRSMYTPQAFDSGIGEHTLDMSYNTVMDMIFSQWGTAAEAAGTVYNWLSGSDKVNYWQEWGRRVQNYGNASKSKISEAAEAEGMFDSWRGFTGTTASILTQAGTQLLIGRLTAGVGTGLMAIGKGGQIAQKVISGAPWLFGAVYASNAMNEEAKAAGLSDNDRMLLSIGAGATVFAAELGAQKFLGASGIADGFASKGSQKAILQNMKNKFNGYIAKELDNFVGAAATQATRGAGTKTILQKIGSGIQSFASGSQKIGGKSMNFVGRIARAPIAAGYSKAPQSFWGRVGGGVAAGYEEGWEEVFEGISNSWMKSLYNDGYIGIDGPPQNAEPGKGLFQNTKYDHFLSDFVGGFIGGGFTGALMGGRYKRDITDNTVAELAASFDNKNEAIKQLTKMFDKGVFESSLLDVNDTFVSVFNKDQQAKVRSRNDIAFETLLAELDTAYQIKESLGLHKAETIAKVMKGDMALVKDTIEYGMRSKKLDKEIAEKKQILDNTEDTAPEYSTIKKQYDDAVVARGEMKTIVDKIMSGQAISEYKAHMAAREFLANNEYQKRAFTALQIPDKKEKDEKIRTLWDDAIQVAEQKNLWNDQQKAIELVRKARAYANTYAELKKEHEENRKKSKDKSQQTNFDFDITDDISFKEFLKGLEGEYLFEGDFAEKFDKIRQRVQEQLDEISSNVFKKFNINEEAGLSTLFEDSFFDPSLKEFAAEGSRDSNGKIDYQKALDLQNQVFNDDDYKRLEELQSNDKSLQERQATLQKENTNFIPTAGTQTRDGFEVFFPYDDAYSDKIDEGFNYFSLDPKNNKSEPITESDYIDALKTSNANVKSNEFGDSFEYNGKSYIKQNTSKAKIKANTRKDGSYVEEERLFDYFNVDIPMQKMLLLGESVNGEPMSKVFQDIYAEFQRDGVVTEDMKNKLKAIKQTLDEKDSILNLINWTKNLKENNLLDESQTKYFALDGFDAMGSNIDAWLTQHEYDKARYQTIKADLNSKADREGKMKMLSDRMLKMFSHIANKLNTLIPLAYDIDINGTIIQKPEILSSNATEEDVLKTMQYWHHFIHQLPDSEKVEFVKNFKMFWHIEVQKMASEGLNTKREWLNNNRYSFPSASEQGLFQEDFESIFDEDLFESSKKVGVLNTNKFRELFYYNALNMIINMDMGIHYKQMVESVLQQVVEPSQVDFGTLKYKGDHTAEQLMLAMFGHAHLFEGINRRTKDDAFVGMLDSLKTIMKIGTYVDAKEDAVALFAPYVQNGSKQYDGSHILDNVMLVTGSGGVGKTSFFVRTMVDLALKNNINEIVLVAPNKAQLDSIKKAIPLGAESLFKTFLIEDFIPKQHEFNNSLIFIDEVSLLTQKEKNSLYFHGKLSEINGNKVEVIEGSQRINSNNTVFILGDELQAPYSIAEETNAPKLSEFSQHAFTLTAVKRTSSVDIFKIQNIFRSEAVGLNTKLPIITSLNYSEKNGIKKGVKLNNDKTSFINEAKEAVKNKKGYIITYDQEYYNQMIDGLPADVHNRVYFLTDKKYSPQGLTLEGEVYVYLPYDEMTQKESVFKTNPKYYNRYALTAVGRAKTFVSLFTGNGLGNESSNLVDEDKLVQFEDNNLETATRMKELYDRYSSVSSNLIDIPLSNGGTTIDTDEEVVVTDDIKEDNDGNVVKEDEIKEDEKNVDEQEEDDSDFIPVEDDEIEGENVSDKDKEKAADEVVTDYDKNKTRAKAKARKYKTKKERQKQNKEKTYDTKDPVSDTVNEDDFIITEGSSGKPTTGIDNKIITNIDKSDTSAIVTRSGFIIKKGAKYYDRKTDSDTQVLNIKYDDATGKYYIITDREALPLEMEAFEQKYIGKPKEDNNKITALTDIVGSGVLSIYGNALPKDDFNFSGLNLAQQRELYNQNLKALIKFTSRLGEKISVRVTVVKGKEFVMYNGKDLGKKELAIKVEVNDKGTYKPIGYLFLENPLSANKIGNSEQIKYNDFLYELLSEKENGYVIGNDLKLNKRDTILSNTVIGFDKINKSAFTTFAELKKMMSDIGWNMSDPHQVEDKDKKAGSPKTVSSVIYVSPDINPNESNGVPIYVASRSFDQMNADEQNIFIDTIDSLIKSAENALISRSEESFANALSILDNIFKFNQSSITRNINDNKLKNTNLDKLGLTDLPINKKTIAENRLEFLNRMIESMQLGDTSFDFMRLPTIINKLADNKILSEELLISRQQVYLTTPTIKIRGAETGLGIDPITKLYDKIESEEEFKDYVTREAQLHQELIDLLGDGITLEFFQSENIHGFVDKLGKIGLNTRNGYGRSRTLYHEVVHYATEFLMTDQARAAIFDEIASRFPELANWRDSTETRIKVAEKIAEEGERFQSDRRNLKGISKYLQMFYDIMARFLSNILPMKRAVDNFYVDLFVMKRYKNKDNTSLTPVREEMDLDYLYSKNKNFVPMATVESYFYNRDVARSATALVSNAMFNEAVAPNLNSRLFKDEEVSFTDMINRAEYSMRKMVMFQIDKNGFIQRSNQTVDGKTVEDLPILRDLYIKVDRKDIQLFKWAFNPKDNIGKTQFGLQLMYYNTEKKAYEVAPVTEKGVFFLDDRNRRMIRKSLRDALQNYKIETANGQVNVLDNTDEAKSKLNSIISDTDRMFYRAAVSMIDEVFNGMVNNDFPHLDVQSIISKSRKYTFDDIADFLNEVNDANIRRDSEETNPMDRQSDIMKIILKNTPMFIVNENGEPLKTDRKVNPIITQAIMNNITGMFWAAGTTGYSAIDNFKSGIERKLSIIISRAGESLNYDDDYIALNSMYQEFFAETEGFTHISHFEIMKWRDQLFALEMGSQEYNSLLNYFYDRYKFVTGNQKALGIISQDDAGLTLSEFEAGIKNRAKHAEMILNALVTYFASNARNSYSKVNIYGQGEDARFYHSEMLPVHADENKLRLERHFSDNLHGPDGFIADRYKDVFGFNAEKIVYNPVYNPGEPKQESVFYMQQDGLYYRPGKRVGDQVKIFSIENGFILPVNQNEINQFLKEKNPQKSFHRLLKDIFTYYLNYSGISDNVIKRLSRPATSNDAYGIENLHEILAPLILSAYTYSAEKTFTPETINLNAPLYQLYSQVLSNYALSKNRGQDYGKSNDSSIEVGKSETVNYSEALETDEVKRFYPPAFYIELESLAKLMSTNVYDNSIRSINRQRKVFTLNVQDTMGHLLRDNNDTAVDMFSDMLNETNGVHENPNARGKLVLNPMLGRKGFTGKKTTNMGLQGTSTSKELDQMSVSDNAYYDITAFLKSFNNSTRSFEAMPVMLPFYNQAQRTRQGSAPYMFNINKQKIAGSNGLLKRTDTGVDVDYSNIMLHVWNRFAIREEEQVNSLNRWARLIQALGVNISPDLMDIDTTIKGWKDKRNRLYSQVSKIVDESNFTIIDGNVLEFQKTNELFSGIDYKIVVADDGSSKVQLGYETTMYQNVTMRSTIDNSNIFKSTPAAVYNYNNYTKKYSFNIPMPRNGIVENIKVEGVTLDQILDSRDMNTDFFILEIKDSKYGNIRLQLNDEHFRPIIDGLYASHYETTNNILTNENFRLFNKDNRYKSIPTESKNKGIKYNQQFIPEWKAFIIGTEMANAYFDNAFKGSEAVEMDNTIRAKGGPIKYNQNSNKRALMWSSTGMLPASGTHLGIDKETLTLHVADLIIPGKIDTINQEVVSLNHVVNDGGTKANPLHVEAYYNSFGGNRGSANKYGGGKTLAISKNLATGRVTEKKHARDTITKELYESSPDDNILFKIMNNPRARPFNENLGAMPGLDGRPMFMTYSDLNSLQENDSMLQRFYIIYGDTQTEQAYKQTINNLVNNTDFKNVEEVIEDVYDGNTEKNAVLKEWSRLNVDGLAIGKYYFVADLFSKAGIENVIEDESNYEKDWDRAIKNTWANYADIRSKVVEHNKKQKDENVEPTRTMYHDILDRLAYISSTDNASTRKEQAKGFVMPYKSLNPGAGSSALIPMQYFSPENDTNIYDNLFDLWNAHLQNGGMNDYVFKSIYEKFNNTSEILQMNPNRPTDDSEESPIVQAMSVILSNPNMVEKGFAEKMSNQLSELIHLGLKDMMTRLSINEGMSADEVEEILGRSKNIVVSGLSQIEQKKIEQFVKQKIKRSMSTTDDSTLLSVIINDDQININVAPGAVTRVVQYLSSFIKKEAVKRKVEAVRLSQMSGNHIQILELKETGEVFMLSQAKKHAERLGKSVDELFDVANARSLKHATIKQVEKQLTTEQENTLAYYEKQLNDGLVTREGYYRAKTEYLKQQGLLETTKGEAIIPATKFDKYNIPKSMGLNEVFRIYTEENGVTKDINLREFTSDFKTLKSKIAEIVAANMFFQLGTTKVSKKQYITTRYAEGITRGKNKYFDLMFLDGANEYFKTNKYEITKITNKAYKELYGKEKFEAFINNTFANENEYLESKENYEKLLNAEAQTYLAEFIEGQVDTYSKAIKAVSIMIDTNIGMRIPSGPGSGFVADIVGFVNDNGSVGYVNTIKNMIDGSDQDIDQFTMYYSADTMVDMGIMDEVEFNEYKKKQYNTKEESAVSEVLNEEGNMINNKLLAMIKDYYMDPENSNFTMAPINLDDVKNSADRAYMKLFPNGDLSYNYGQSLLYRKVSMDGKAVGPFALAQKVQTLLYSAYHANGKNGISSDIYPFALSKENYSLVPIWMEMLVNAATDNPKLLALGALNININNADTIASMFFASDEILKRVNEKIIQENLTREKKKDLFTQAQIPLAIFEFLKSDAHEQIFENQSRQGNMIDGGFSENYFSNSHRFYKSLFDGYEENLMKATIAGQLRLQYKTDLENALRELQVSESEIFTRLGLTNLNFDDATSLFRSLYNSKINTNLNKEAKAKHLALKHIIDLELNNKIADNTPEIIRQIILDAINGNSLADSYNIYTEISDLAVKNETIESARQQSEKLSELITNVIIAKKNFSRNEMEYKRFSKKTDKEGFMKDAYLIAKYSMLGEWMKNTIKIANINQFNLSNTYDIMKFEKQFKFSTGYSINEMLDHYDKFRALKENNETLTPNQYFKEHAQGKTIDNIRETAFSTKANDLVKTDKKWMFETLEYNDEAINFAEDFHKISNLVELIMSRPDIVESIRAVTFMKEVADNIFISRHKDLNELHDEVMNELGYDLWSEEKHNTFYEEINKMFLADYLSNTGENNISDRFFEALKVYNIEANGFLYGAINNGMRIGLSNPTLSTNYIKQFPDFFESTIKPKLIEDHMNGRYVLSGDSQEFLDRIVSYRKNSFDWLDVVKSQIVSPSEIEMLRNGFNGLPENVKTIITAYQLVKDGFDYQKSFFGQVMPVEEMRAYSDFIEENINRTRSFKGRSDRNGKSIYLENVKLRMLSNVNLDLLQNEKLIPITQMVDGKPQTRRIGIAPVSANGVVRYYKKTILTKRYKKSTQRTYALAETEGISGVGIIKGKTTNLPGNKVVNFKDIVDIVSNDLTTNRSLMIFGGVYNVQMNPFAYLRYNIHGHAENIIQNRVNRRLKELQRQDLSIVQISEQEYAAIVNDFLVNTDFNNDAYRLKGTPNLSNPETFNANKKVIQENTIQLLKESLAISANKKGIDVGDMLQSLYGKVIADEYFNGDTSMSYALYAMMNTMLAEQFDANTFFQIKQLPADDQINVAVKEKALYRNRNGLIGNYFSKAPALLSKDVVTLYQPNTFGRGRKDSWYEHISNKGIKDDTLQSVADSTMARMLIAKSFGLNDSNVLDILEVNILDANSVEIGLKSFYSHLNTNVTKELSNRHAAMLNAMRNTYSKATSNVEAVKAIMNNPDLQGRLEFTSEMKYNVGDIIYFSDGTEGVVTQNFGKSIGYFLKYDEGIDNVYRPSEAQRATMSLEQIVGNNNTHKALDGFLKTISKSMPNVLYKFVTNEEANRIFKTDKPTVSFFKDGIVYINKDLADEGVALHEFAHPWVLAISQYNKPLFKAMADMVAQTPIMDYVRDNYGDLSEQEMILEAIPTYIQMRYYSRFRNEMSQQDSLLVDAFFDNIRLMFKENIGGSVNFESSLDDFNKVDFSAITLNQVVDAVINDMKKGKLLSEITTAELKRMMPYVMRASTSSKLKNINLSNINQLFQSRGSYDEETAIKRAIKKNINSFKNYEGISGTYDLTNANPMFYDALGKYSDTLRDNYIAKIVNDEYSAYEKINERSITFFDKLKELQPLAAATETLFSSWTNRHNLKDAEDSVKTALQNDVINMMDKVGYNPMTDKAMTFEAAMNHLKINIPNNLKNKNAVVIVHNMATPNESITIYSTVTSTLENYGSGEKATLGEAYMSDEMNNGDARMSRRLVGLSLGNTNGEIEALKNAIIVMAMKKQNPNIRVRAIGAMRVTGNNIRVEKRYVTDILPQIDILFNNLPQLKENLERDLYDVVTDKSLYNNDLYKVNYLELLSDYFKSVMSTDGIKDSYKKKVGEVIEQINAVRTERMFSNYKNIQDAVRSRIQYLGSILGDRKSNNEEYQFLLKIYRELTGYNEVRTKFVNAISLDEKLYGTADRWSGQVRTWVFDQLDLAKRKGVEETLPFVELFDKMTKELDQIKGGVISKFKDGSHELFKNVFKKRTIKDVNGKDVSISLHELHWDENDIETSRALANNEISREELAVGKWLADKLYNEFVDYVMVTERNMLSNKLTDGEDALRFAAETEVNRRYKKGMLPVFKRSVGAAITDGRIGEAFNLYMKSAGKWYGGNLYEEYQQSDINEMQKDVFKKLLSPFWNQFQSSIEYGGDSRLKLLGLDYDGDNLVLVNPKRQTELSYNLQNIGNFTMLSSIRTKHLQEGVVSVNIAMDMLRGEEATRGVDTKDIREHLENYVNRQVYGNMPSLTKMLANNVSYDVDAVLDGTGKLINMIHLALNVKLGAKNAVAAGTKLIVNSLVNSLSGRKGFNITTISRAATEMFSNPEKVTALNKKYQLVNVSERDIINHWKYVHTRKNITESDMQMIMHFIGDHYAQLIGAMAQMMAEGTYDAHDNQGNYDYKLDRRFYADNGEMKVLGNALYQDILEQQYKEGYHIPEDGKTLTHAYSQRDENRVKVEVQRFVGELQDSQFKNLISSYGVARAVMSLKSYIFNVAQSWWKNPYESVQTGARQVYMKDGKPEVDWVPELTEGVIQTLIYCTKGLGKALKGDVSDFKNMSSYQKRNLVSMATFTAVVAGVYLLADAMQWGDDDDKKKKKYKYAVDPKTGKRKRINAEENPEWISTRLMEMMYMTKYTAPSKDESATYAEELAKYILLGAVNEQLSYVSPARPVQDILQSPNPYIWQAKNLGDLFLTTMALPWTIKDEGVAAGIDKTIYSFSKNVPFGSMYRTGHEYVESFYNMIEEQTK